MKNLSGKILFLDRSDINTDEIIPAKYLTELSKQALKPFCLEDLNLAGFDPVRDVPGKGAIVTRANFGCGSSREHAPWVLECNDINLVIAENFARIFRQNMFNCGMMCIELSPEQIEEIFQVFSGTDAFCSADPDTAILTISNEKESRQYSFNLGTFDKALIKAGGWIEYGDQKY